jgi:hypothetical protein
MDPISIGVIGAAIIATPNWGRRCAQATTDEVGILDTARSKLRRLASNEEILIHARAGLTFGRCLMPRFAVASRNFESKVRQPTVVPME